MHMKSMHDRPYMRPAYDFRNHRIYHGTSRRRMSRGDAAYWKVVVVLSLIDVFIFIYLLYASGLIWWIL